MFRSDMIDAYNGRYTGSESWLWCPILGEWYGNRDVTAAHLFAYMHGQDTMDAIFGKKNKPELFSPRNGLLISLRIEEYSDTGYLVIVPQLPDRPTKTQLATWLLKEPREYKTRVINPNWKMLNLHITRHSSLLWKVLDNRPLRFRSDFRPAARCFYFHYCLQLLRCAWKEPPNESKVALKSEIGKSYWGTPGRYLPRNMLLAFVEEVGHEYDQLMEGASCSMGEDEVLLATASHQVKAKDFVGCDDSEDESESEDENDAEEC